MPASPTCAVNVPTPPLLLAAACDGLPPAATIGSGQGSSAGTAHTTAAHSVTKINQGFAFQWWVEDAESFMHELPATYGTSDPSYHTQCRLHLTHPLGP